MRRTLPIASPPNGFPTLPPKPSRSPRSSAQVTISLCPAPRNSRSPEKHSALNRSSKIPPSPSYSSSCATPPAPLRHTPPAAFSTPVFPLTASTNPANLFSISIAWKILPALTLLFPPARFRRPAIASPLHCPSAKNAIMIRGLSIFPLAVHFELLCPRETHHSPPGAARAPQNTHQHGAPRLRARAWLRQHRRALPPGHRPRAILLASQHLRIRCPH